MLRIPGDNIDSDILILFPVSMHKSIDESRERPTVTATIAEKQTVVIQDCSMTTRKLAISVVVFINSFRNVKMTKNKSLTSFH